MTQVEFDVAFEVVFPFKGFLAQVTHEGPFGYVKKFVGEQLSRLSKGFVTYWNVKAYTGLLK